MRCGGGADDIIDAVGDAGRVSGDAGRDFVDVADGDGEDFVNYGAGIDEVRFDPGDMQSRVS